MVPTAWQQEHAIIHNRLRESALESHSFGVHVVALCRLIPGERCRIALRACVGIASAPLTSAPNKKVGTAKGRRSDSSSGPPGVIHAHLRAELTKKQKPANRPQRRTRAADGERARSDARFCVRHDTLRLLQAVHPAVSNSRVRNQSGSATMEASDIRRICAAYVIACAFSFDLGIDVPKILCPSCRTPWSPDLNH